MTSQSALVHALSVPTNGGHAAPVWYPNTVTCADGFTMSVISGAGTYCHPRPSLCTTSFDGVCSTIIEKDVPCDYQGPFTELEVGFPTERPEPWEEWSEHTYGTDDGWSGVYSYVPVQLIAELILLHGGEVQT